jgi:S-adenosyl methyltransferase
MDSDAPSPLSSKIDTTVPASPRIWNYWLGGKDYYPVDKLAGDQFAQFFPGIFDLASAARHFIARVVGYLAGEAGIRQFLDIGTGLPSHDSTHEIAQRMAPDSRVVYVDRSRRGTGPAVAPRAHPRQHASGPCQHGRRREEGVIP